MIATEPLSIQEIRRRLGTSRVGRQLYLFAEVESTNSMLRKLAREGAIEGTVVMAEAQTAGRGRLGQPWFSPAGVNVYASTLFRPRFPLRDAPRFSFIASLAVADAVKELGLTPAIKWPNDVLVKGRKVAGSLVECAARGEEIDFLVLGVGVNVNVDAEALRQGLGPRHASATSLSAALGRDVDRNALAASYLSVLDAWASCYEREGPEPILAAWRDRDIVSGRRVEVRGSGPSFDGRALGIDGHGALVVEDARGRRHVVLTEEILLAD